MEWKPDMGIFFSLGLNSVKSLSLAEIKNV